MAVVALRMLEKLDKGIHETFAHSGGHEMGLDRRVLVCIVLDVEADRTQADNPVKLKIFQFRW